MMKTVRLHGIRYLGIGLFTILGLGGLIIANPLHAATSSENTELIDEFDAIETQEQRDNIRELEARMEFTSFSSCSEMESVLEQFLLENKDYFENRGYFPYYGHDMFGRGGIAESMPSVSDGDIATDSALGMGGGSSSSSTDVSETNIQVAGVDEPDILKTDGDYLYYYNQSEQKIYIIRSPLDRQVSTIVIDNFEVISTIAIPKQFRNIELFIENNTLVILGQRWREHTSRSTILDQYSRVNLVTYDITNKQLPKLTRFTDMDGRYEDARLIDGKVYIITQLGVNWGHIWQEFSSSGVINSREMLPKSIDVSRTNNSVNTHQQLQIQGQLYPYNIKVNTTNCNSILYVLPSSETLQENGLMPSFTIVRSVDVSNPNDQIDSVSAFGSTQEVHMTKDSLYLTSPLYFQDTISCPPGMACIMPTFRGGETHTLLHKFDRNFQTLRYRQSTLLPGSPLTQWSMSEDVDGNFRIITQTMWPNLNTHLFILGEDLKVRGMVRNIEENEEFKASRFMGDKLYLVTFERVDPLFVIDLEDPDNPSIIGELKIPGYSTYLHPFSTTNTDDTVEYLIGLGYDTRLTEWGGVVNAGVKVDLYKVDYTDIDDQGMVAVTQEFTQTFGEDGSWSEAIENPRMFVWNEKTKTLILPMILQDREEQQHCNVQYNASGEEISRNCWTSFNFLTNFAGMKRIGIDIQGGISALSSYDYKDQLVAEDSRNWGPEPMPVEVDGGIAISESEEAELTVSDGDAAVDIVRKIPDGEKRYINQREFRNLMMRVGYLGDAVYTLHNQFGHIRIPQSNQEKYLLWE